MNYPNIKDMTRETEFKQKLQALLEEYRVEMEVHLDSSKSWTYDAVLYFHSYDEAFKDCGDHFVDSSFNFSLKEGIYGHKCDKF